MFTIDQIKSAHSKVKSGADFPNYIKDLIELGVTSYVTFVNDGHTLYYGNADFQTASPPKYDTLIIESKTNKEQFIQDLKAHQHGKTNYPTFCQDCAKSGIEKWVVSMANLTCIYYDSFGDEILIEKVPQ